MYEDLGAKYSKMMKIFTIVPAPLSHISSINLFFFIEVCNVDRKNAEIATVSLPSWG
jgi:hypothetical protein